MIRFETTDLFVNAISLNFLLEKKIRTIPTTSPQSDPSVGFMVAPSFLW